MLDWIYAPSGWLALATLTGMEIVLGIDNVIFVSLIGARLPTAQARIARMFGLALALVLRLACLTLLTRLIALTRPVFEIYGFHLSWRDIVLLLAGLFLMLQATLEIHNEMDRDPTGADKAAKPRSLGFVIFNIAVMDLVFSFDSILTAIGIARDLVIMIIAIVISLIVMYAAANVVARFIHNHPTTKVLALCFLVLIGLSLVAEGSGFDLPRGYLYFAMVFASGVEGLNILAKRRRRKPDAGEPGRDSAAES